jgi:glucose/arabinose dehydrogenase
MVGIRLARSLAHRREPLRLVSLAALALLPLAVLAAPSRAQTTLPTGFADQLVIGGFDFPVGMAFLPDGRLFVIEQKSAAIHLVVNGARAATDPVCTVDNVKTTGDEQGLLGIAVDPGWPARPYVYIHCDENTPTNTIRISRYTVTGDLTFTGNGAVSIDVASRYDLINTLPDVALNHNGGTLRFGLDGKLYDSMGEDAQSCLAQDDSTLHGVITRLEVNNLPNTPGGPAPLALITPSDNPQVAAPNLKTRLIYAYGLRNPYRFQIDSATGDLFIADVGNSQYEEIDRAATGGLNFGWPNFEGPVVFNAGCPATNPTAPIYSFDRSAQSAAAFIAGPVYHAPPAALNGFPVGYAGDFFFSDYYGGYLRRLHGGGSSWALAAPVAGQPNTTDWGSGFENVSDYAMGPDGAIWYVLQYAGTIPALGAGQIRKIVPATTPPGGGGGVSVTFAAPYPSPATGFANLSYTLSADAVVHLVIFDLTGRAVRHVVDGQLQTASTYQPTWDGKDDDGRAVRAGLYVVQLRAAGNEISHRVMLLR